MVGYTGAEEAGILLLMVFFPPLAVILGINFLLATIGASTLVIILVSIFNIGLSIYLLIRWGLIQDLASTVQAVLQS